MTANMKKRVLILLALSLLLAIPAYAVFNEKNFAQTLSILRSELHQENEKIENMQSRLRHSQQSQHDQLVEMMKKCNELSLILYSQNQDYTFDITYALEEVTRQYEDYTRQRMPYDEIVERLNLEIERYEHLAEALRRLPPALDKLEAVPDSLSAVMDSIDFRESLHHHEHQEIYEHDHAALYDSTGNYIRTDEALLGRHLSDTGHDGHDDDDDDPFFLDEQGCRDRDSCLFYTLNLLAMYTSYRDQIIMDSDHYESMSSRLEESYNYARNRYRLIQKHIFIDGQDNYFKVLGTLPRYTRLAIQDTRRKYGLSDDSTDAEIFRQSEWRGPMINGFILFILFYILLATLISKLGVFLLRNRVKWFQTEEFRQRSPVITLLSGILIFAITVMIATATTGNHFFQVASSLLLVYAWLLAAILISLLIRIQPDNIRKVSRLYMPVALLGLIVITFRIIFIPNRLINLIFPLGWHARKVYRTFRCRKASF